MRNKAIYVLLLVTLCVVGTGVWKVTRSHGATASAASSGSTLANWNPAAAASYLDYRESWWQGWSRAQKDHGTVCISCHTVVPYALARPALERGMGSTKMPAAEKAMLDSVEKRVGGWSEMKPFYSDVVDGPGKTAESHATEAVLNAVILLSTDAAQEHLRPITRTALDEAWALQEQTGTNAGGWKWQDFNLAPWESAESGYQGSAMLAIALGNAPDHYATDANNGKHMQMLRDYLQRQYASQPLMSQVYVLWASAQMPGLLNETQHTKLLTDIGRQQQSDGGWALSLLNGQANWKRLISSSDSDGCATGLVVMALEESGTSRNDKMLMRGLQWLAQHQNKDGSWTASSLNEKRDPESDIGRFMSDAATGYAVLALETAQHRTSRGTTLAESPATAPARGQ